MSNTLFEFHGVKRGKEIKEFTLSSLPQNTKLVMNPVMKVSGTSLDAVPGKCYLIHAVDMSLRVTGADATELYYIYTIPYNEAANVTLFSLASVPNVAACYSKSLSGINILSKPNTAVSIGNVGGVLTTQYTAIYYSEVDVID